MVSVVASMMLLLLAAATAAAGPATVVPITVDVHETIAVTPGTFLAHGWEPWTATQAFVHFDNPALVKTMSHLRGQTIRFGGISADWLDYVVSDQVTAPCTWGRPEGRPFTAGGQCPFSTGALDKLLDFVAEAGVELLFDLNELVGRNCTEAGKRGKGEWCGDAPSPWETKPVLALLQHLAARNESGQAVPIGFELGNVRSNTRPLLCPPPGRRLTETACLSVQELFAPQHLPRDVAVGDIQTLAGMMRQIWGERSPGPAPRFYASGTNDCNRLDSSETIGALLHLREGGADAGFSFHSYPGNLQQGWNKSDLTSFLLNTTWLRTEMLADGAACLPVLARLPFAVTEAQSMCGGSFAPGAPTTASFINGFFTIANLGQWARAGASLVARWGIPELLMLGGAGWDTSQISSDFFLYHIYSTTVGHGVLRVDGDEASDVLMYAHCASEHYGANGTVTVFAANPSPRAVSLKLSPSMPTTPRMEWVLTAPKGDLASMTPVLNGDEEKPLRVSADGSLPPMEGRFCSSGNTLTLPPRSQGFFVLLAAMADTACNDDSH